MARSKVSPENSKDFSVLRQSRNGLAPVLHDSCLDARPMIFLHMIMNKFCAGGVHRASILNDEMFGERYNYGMAEAAGASNPINFATAVGRDVGSLFFGALGFGPKPEKNEAMCAQSHCPIRQGNLQVGKQAFELFLWSFTIKLYGSLFEGSLASRWTNAIESHDVGKVLNSEIHFPTMACESSCTCQQSDSPSSSNAWPNKRLCFHVVELEMR